MSSEWPFVMVEDVCELIVDCVNKTAPIVTEVTPYRMIRTTNVRNGRIDLSGCKFVKQETYKTWTRRAQLNYGDVVLTREAPIGEVGMVTEAEGVFLGQRLMQYRVNPQSLDARFLLYSFLSPSLQQQFGSHEGSGSVVSHIRVGDCFKFKLKLPPLEVQQGIATMLGAIDDRIALLRETNCTLEAIAQVLFKSWFVDFDPVHAKQQGELPIDLEKTTAALFPNSFEISEMGLIPTGWKIERIDNLLELAYGKALKASERINGQVPVYGSGGVTGYHNEALVDGPSIIIGRKGTVGSLYWEDRPFFPIDTVFFVKSKLPLTYCYYLLKTLGLSEMNTDAAVPGLNRNNVYRLLVRCPSPELLTEFDNIVSGLRHRIFLNMVQIQTLTALRDTLLPRLISGQLRLPDLGSIAELKAA
ncbi:restriction endonuclease subunit S [Undibacterium sp. Ji42W]|uniref:restriction endonuclease subunit S n=1 Tax=Undibacterium sp. Ji42W TaxID=3413039 RepID=UPI003BF2AEE0